MKDENEQPIGGFQEVARFVGRAIRVSKVVAKLKSFLASWSAQADPSAEIEVTIRVKRKAPASKERSKGLRGLLNGGG